MIKNNLNLNQINNKLKNKNLTNRNFKYFKCKINKN